MSEHLPRRALPPVLRESKDVRLTSMLALFALIGSALLLTVAVAYWVFPGSLRDHRFAQPFPQYPNPVLQSDPAADMRAFRAEKLRRLNSAGWVDREAGRVHIPIEQAMRAVAAEGIPGWPTAPVGRAASVGSGR
jgi:hypothetical protein